MTHPDIPHHVLAQATATRCCVCKAKLTDAESVEHGIGPVCSKKYYDPEHVPTDKQVRDALGTLASSDLPPHIVDGFIKLVNNDRTAARQGCNLLVYWASVNYADRNEVFKCTEIIRCLGYLTLADKLEIDRTEGVIIVHEDHFETYLLRTKRLIKDMERIPGAKPLIKQESGIGGVVSEKRLKRGRKEGWWVPKSETDHFKCVLGVHLAGKLMCGSKGLWQVPYCRWSQLLKFRQPKQTDTPKIPSRLNLPATASVVFADDPIFIVDGKDGELRVVTPYDTTFLSRLKDGIPRKQRRWDRNQRCWKVGIKYQAKVLELVVDCYGVAVSATTP